MVVSFQERQASFLVFRLWLNASSTFAKERGLSGLVQPAESLSALTQSYLKRMAVPYQRREAALPYLWLVSQFFNPLNNDLSKPGVVLPSFAMSRQIGG